MYVINIFTHLFCFKVHQYTSGIYALLFRRTKIEPPKRQQNMPMLSWKWYFISYALLHPTMRFVCVFFDTLIITFIFFFLVIFFLFFFWGKMLNIIHFFEFFIEVTETCSGQIESKLNNNEIQNGKRNTWWIPKYQWRSWTETYTKASGDSSGHRSRDNED